MKVYPKVYTPAEVQQLRFNKDKERLISEIFKTTLESLPGQLELARLLEKKMWVRINLVFPKYVQLSHVESYDVTYADLQKIFLSQCKSYKLRMNGSELEIRDQAVSSTLPCCTIL